jgi:hypothetical protein
MRDQESEDTFGEYIFHCQFNVTIRPDTLKTVIVWSLIRPPYYSSTNLCTIFPTNIDLDRSAYISCAND